MLPIMKKIAEKTASLQEAGARIESREGKGARYLVRAMGWEPGAEFIEGSSGRYPVAAVKRDFPVAFPEGTRMKANHDGFCEAGGDIRRVMGKRIGEWDFREDGAYTAMELSPEWDTYMEQFADVIGLSISAGVELAERPEPEGYDKDGRPLDADGNLMEDEGRPIIERFLAIEESPYNSIDFVEAPGADGRVIQALESAKGHFERVGMREAATFASVYLDQRRREHASEAAPPRDIKKENAMDPEKVAEMVKEGVANAIPAIVEALKPPVAEPETIRMEGVAEAAFEAGLSKGSREAVYARVAGGQPVDEAVAAEKSREDEITAIVEARLAEQQGHGGVVVGEGTSASTLDSEWESVMAASATKGVI